MNQTRDLMGIPTESVGSESALVHPAVMMGVHAAHFVGWPVPVLTFAASTAVVWMAARASRHMRGAVAVQGA